ncbi:MAG: dihydropteroate synthase [Alphaproteobacteria bacterium]|jgi:2-amino-4-hydroxy-6-hydroxymethyldihydropteridine diphosphokinase/dihydropteroate synthase|nr:dihydropteroate synthase [Candidatus Jidaibacter sp.]
MIILALGTNLGNRMHNLHIAVDKLAKFITSIKTSAVFETKAMLPDNAPPSWDINYYNMVLSCDTKLDPRELLAAVKSIEKQMGREDGARWAPRIIDIDILFYNDVFIESEDLHIPHKEVLNRDFVILPLMQIAPNLKFTGHNNVYGHTLTQIFNGLQNFQSSFKRSIPFDPKLMGIVNITPDSFSDGGQFVRADDAVTHALHLYKAGAFYIDFGAQSTNPRSMLIDQEEEFARLDDVISGFISEVGVEAAKHCISVDSFSAAVLIKLLSKYKVSVVNDQSAGRNQAIIASVADARTKYVAMHSIDLPTSQKYLLSHYIPAHKQLISWSIGKIEELLEQGLHLDNIILDPGIGFGKSPIQSIDILKNVAAFKYLGCDVLIGHSRKSYHGVYTIAEPAKRDTETAVEAAVISSYADVIRVHNVRKAQKSIMAFDAINKFYSLS